MGRELRQRKPVTYNESLLSAEASSSAVSKDENTDHGSLLKFTRTGINNTANCNALQTASADIKQYKRNRSSARKEAGHRSQSRRYFFGLHTRLRCRQPPAYTRSCSKHSINEQQPSQTNAAGVAVAAKQKVTVKLTAATMKKEMQLMLMMMQMSFSNQSDAAQQSQLIRWTSATASLGQIVMHHLQTQRDPAELSEATPANPRLLLLQPEGSQAEQLPPRSA